MTAMQQEQRRLATAAGRRCAVYLRISEDRSGEALGVDRQQPPCMALAEGKGWQVVEVYIDNDKTASKRNSQRPEWLRMLADIRRGHVNAVVCWDQDRLVRQPSELEDFILLADTYGVELSNVNVTMLDLSTPQGRLFARQLGAFAAFEGEHKSQRQRLAFQQAAEAGKPHMGGRRPFGYLDDRVTVHPAEGRLVADAARRVLAGETVRSIVLEWNERGVTHTTGSAWTVSALTTVLRSARISGRREVRGGATTKELGTIVATDCWEAIVTPEDSDRLRQFLTSAERRSAPRSQRARHLLSGVLVCGHCDTPMVALNWLAGGKSIYRCPSNGSATRPSCGRLSVARHHVEPTMRDVLLTALDSPEFRERLHARPEVDPLLVEQVGKDQQKLDDLATDYANDDITRAEWVTARDVVKARLVENKARLARATSTTALGALDGEGALLDRWEGLNLSQQRAVLAEVFTSVRVLPAERRGLRTFDPNRLVPTFRF